MEKELEEKQVEKSEDEPSWYHYFIILGIIVFIFAGIYYGFSFYESRTNPIIDNDNNNNNTLTTYKYPYNVGNVTYNIYFNSPVLEINKWDYIIEPSKLDILNTVSYTISFKEYVGDDNGEISKTSSKMVSFLKNVYFFEFDVDSFKMFDEINCTDSDLLNKVIVFDPYSDKTGIFINENGCIEVLSDDASIVMELVDKFIYNMITMDE